MTREEMIRNYNNLAAAHKYIVGFVQGQKLYYTIMNSCIRDDMLKLDRASSSKGGMLKVRVRVSAKLKAMLIGTGKAIVCGMVDELVKDSKYNKGENFERIVTEKLTGELWVKDSIPFYVKGDITLNGEEVQVKLDGAELTNEKTLARTVEILANA